MKKVTKQQALTRTEMVDEKGGKETRSETIGIRLEHSLDQQIVAIYYIYL